MLLKIDGSYGEGGGQVLRTSLALSVILGRPIEIVNIRAGRSKPGLRPQHLAGVRALARISSAEVQGDQMGSTSLSFAPGEVQSGRYAFDVAEETRSAGAITLLFQSLALPLACGSGFSEITLKGGTHVAWSPPFHYLTDVLLPILSHLGYRAELELRSWGWYPRGGGEVNLRVEPLDNRDSIRKSPGRPLPPEKEKIEGSLKSLNLDKRGELKAIRGISAASNLPSHVVERQARRVIERLHQQGLSVELERLQPPSPGPGSLVFLVAVSEQGIGGFSSLGARGKSAETVADEAVDALLTYLETGCAIEEHLADQLILFLALARSNSSFTTSRISRHLLANLWVVQQFLPVEFVTEGQEGMPGKISTLTAISS